MLGDELHWLLRAAGVPGSEFVLPLLSIRHVLLAAAGRALARVGIDPGGLLRVQAL